MTVFNIKLTQKEPVAEGTIIFHFEKPVDFKYTAGQYGYFILPSKSIFGRRSWEHHFTIVFAPFEGQLGFATRMRNSKYKNQLNELKIGSEVEFDGAEGSFVIKDMKKSSVFITGGIGVTTARSIITQVLYDGFSMDIWLFSSSKSLKSMPFHDHFCQLSDKNKNFRYLPTFTDYEKRLDMDKIRQNITNINEAMFYISGPPGFVDVINEMLINSGINKSNIVFEKFPGY